MVELLAEYSTEHKAIKWLEKIRWDKEPICPHRGICCRELEGLASRVRLNCLILLRYMRHISAVKKRTNTLIKS